MIDMKYVGKDGVTIVPISRSGETRSSSIDMSAPLIEAPLSNSFNIVQEVQANLELLDDLQCRMGFMMNEINRIVKRS